MIHSNNTQRISNNRSGGIVFLLFSILIVIFIVIFYMIYFQNKMESDYVKNLNLKGQAVTNISKLNNVKGIVDKSADLDLEADKYILKNLDTGMFISNLEKDIQSLGLVLDSTNVESLKLDNNDLFEKLSLTLKVKGEEQDVFKFVQLLESIPYNTSISKFNMLYDKDNLVEMSLNLVLIKYIK